MVIFPAVKDHAHTPFIGNNDGADAYFLPPANLIPFRIYICRAAKCPDQSRHSAPHILPYY